MNRRLGAERRSLGRRLRDLLYRRPVPSATSNDVAPTRGGFPSIHLPREIGTEDVRRADDD